MKRILFFLCLLSAFAASAQEPAKRPVYREISTPSDTARPYFLNVAKKATFLDTIVIKKVLTGTSAMPLLVYDVTNKTVDTVTAPVSATSTLLFSQTANGTALTTTSATNILGTGTGTLTVPAGLTAGQTITIEGDLLLSSASSSVGTFTIGPSIAGTALVNWGAPVPTSASATPVTYKATITILTTGSGGTASMSQSWAVSGQTPFKFSGASTATTYSINTTTTNAIGLVAQWGTGAINSIQTVPTFTVKVQ